MKNDSTRNPLIRNEKKVMPLAAVAFFLCLVSAHAQNNTATGNVYGNNYNGPTVTAVRDGRSDLNVLNPDTVEITLNNWTVSGSISISNNFNSLNILTTTGSLTSSNTPALAVFGGTNLTITGGTFSGGNANITSNDWNSAEGALFSNVQTGLVSGTVFQGKTIVDDGNGSGGPPLPGQEGSPNASGSTGLVIQNNSQFELNDTTIKGGSGGSANTFNEDTFANGGMGLEIYSSTVVLSNATVSGGAGGNASAQGSYTSEAFGGHAIYASNAVVEIQSGTFSGGIAGSEDGKTGTGGSALVAVGGSSITNYGGTFTAGAGASPILIENSDLTTYGGNYSGTGRFQTSGSGTNNLNLYGGAFTSLNFYNGSSNGIQYVTASNISVSVDVYQDGGTVDITNLDDDAFQTITIDNGLMIFNEDLTLGSQAQLLLSGADSAAGFQGLEVGNNALVDVGLGEINATALNVLSGATLKFSVITNQYGQITTTGSAAIESNATIVVDATLAGFSTGQTTVTVVRASSMTATNFHSEVQLTQNTNITGRTSVSAPIIDNNISYLFVTLSLSNYWNATGDLEELAVELEGLASDEMNVIINNMGADASKALVEETYFSTMNTFQTAKQGLDAAVGLALSRGTEFREQMRLPQGAQGPDQPGSEWRFWAKYYGQFYHRNQDGLNAEYDSTMHGGAIGMDKSFGNLLIGLSGGAGNYSIDTESDAEQDMNAFQGALYSTYGKEHAYLDAGLAYGANSVESKTADPLMLEGEFDTQLISAYLGGGYGFEFPDLGTVITPEASIRYTLYEQDAYTEKGTAAVPRSFDSFDADSMVGSLGLNASMLNSHAFETFAFKVEGRAHWMREFNPEPGDISYQLVGGANDYLIAYPNLDEDTIRLGIGFTFFNTGRNTRKNVLLRLDFDELIGNDFNSHNLSAKAIYAF